MKLPDKLSQLIRLGIKGLEACEADPNYIIDMWSWHDYHEDEDENIKVCYVCFAGSVMANTLEAPLMENLSPNDYDKDTRNKLYALDNIRNGNIDEVFHFLGYTEVNQEVINNCKGIYSGYSCNHGNYFSFKKYKYPVVFKECMISIADRLEEEEL